MFFQVYLLLLNRKKSLVYSCIFKLSGNCTYQCYHACCYHLEKVINPNSNSQLITTNLSFSSTRVSRPRNKSPPDSVDPTAEAASKSRYYEDRYRERESGRREPDRERERERDRREESHRSRH